MSRVGVPEVGVGPRAASASALLAMTLLVTPVTAQEVAQGELAAAIRAAGHACAKVHEVASTGAGAWRVRCNSGEFSVRRAGDGYDVSPSG